MRFRSRSLDSIHTFFFSFFISFISFFFFVLLDPPLSFLLPLKGLLLLPTEENMKMLLSPILAFLVCSLALAPAAQAAPLSTTETGTLTITPHTTPTKAAKTTTTPSTTIKSTSSPFSSPIPSSSPTGTTGTSGDSGDGFPALPETNQYYENEGAGGDTTGFIHLSIGAQAGIIIAIVIVGLAIMGGCVWFWKKKEKEWKAAMEKRRTLRASRIAAAKTSRGNRTPLANVTNMSAAPGKKPESKKAESSSKNNRSQSSENIVATELTVPNSQFDVMTPTEDEKPAWWKKVLSKQK